MMLSFTKTCYPIAAQDLEAAEARIGAPLPAEYKAFLLRQHGGHPKPDRFLFRQHGKKAERGTVAYFLNLTEKNENLFDYRMTYEDRIPPDTLPIARDPGGDPILLVLAGERKGQIIFWMKEYEEEDGSDTDPFKYTGFVAASFDEFLASLTD